MEIGFSGYAIVPVAAAPWQQSTQEGWFTTRPIWEALDSWDSETGASKDVTGYQFTSAPKYNLAPIGKGGDVGYLTNLVISNNPTIKVTFRNADYSRFKRNWNEKVSGNLKLFGGLELGSLSEGAFGSKITQGSDNSSFTVTFSASPAVGLWPTTSGPPM